MELGGGTQDKAKNLNCPATNVFNVFGRGKITSKLKT
jgi:hypothetical protein